MKPIDAFITILALGLGPIFALLWELKWTALALFGGLVASWAAAWFHRPMEGCLGLVLFGLVALLTLMRVG